jgi:hypothetical protein
MELSTRRTTPFEAELTLEDGELCLMTNANASIKTAALLINGDPLALTWAARDHEWSTRIDDVTNATLVVGLRATAPVRDVDGALLVTLNKNPLMPPVRYTLSGSARSIAGRSAWHGPKALPFGEWSDLRLRVRNDGDADFTGGFAAITASAGCSLSGDGERVPGRDGMVLKVAIPTLRVGAAADLTIGVRPCDPTVDSITVQALTPLAEQPLAATFTLVEEASALKLELQETPSIRYGEQLLVRAILSTGSHRTPAGMLDVALEPGGSTSVNFGALGAHERRALYVPVAVTERTLDRGPALLTGVLHEGGRPIARASHQVAIEGNHAVDLRMHVDEADETNAHMLHLAVRNTGDLAIHQLRLTLDPRPQLAAVRDSACLDDEAVLELDGSVPIFDKGIVIDVLAIGAARELTVRLRHAKGKVVMLSATASTEESALATASTEAMFAAGGARKKADGEAARATSKKKALAEETPEVATGNNEETRSNLAASEPVAAEALNGETRAALEAAQTGFMMVATVSGNDARAAINAAIESESGAQTEPPSEAVAEAVEPAPEVQPEPAPVAEEQPKAEAIYADVIPAASLALGQPNAPLGHHIAAALGLQPHGHTTDAEFGAAALRLSQVALQSLELAAKTHQLGVYGTSGYGLPAAIVDAVVELQRVRKLPVPGDDLAAMRVLVSLADVKGARSRDVHRWRRGVLAALVDATIDDLSKPLDSALEEAAA